MGAFFQLPGWFGFFAGSDRSGRQSRGLGVAQNLVDTIVAPFWRVLRKWQGRSLELASLRAIDARTLRDIGVTREQIEERHGRYIFAERRFRKEFWPGW